VECQVWVFQNLEEPLGFMKEPRFFACALQVGAVVGLSLFGLHWLYAYITGLTSSKGLA
jgi:hypothetical protein